MLALSPLLAGVAPAVAQVATNLTPMVVTVSRAAQPADNLTLTVDVFGPERLRRAPALALDDILRESPAFSLFRRSGSGSANPTAQGVSLRGVGPSGAGRTLVLLDGVPLNDPFGGWIAWNKIPSSTVGAVEIVRGGGSGAWGNSALGGVVQILTDSSMLRPGSRRLSLNAEAGNLGLLRFDAAAGCGFSRGSLQIAASTGSTDGYFPLAAPDRGAVDRRLAMDDHVLSARFELLLPNGIETAINLRQFGENRVNGTRLQRNSTREEYFLVSLRRRATDGFAWSAQLYGQDQTFKSFFSTVATGRNVETPANDQFDVPAQAAGINWAGTWNDEGNSTTIGWDARRVDGRTSEDYLYSGGNLTRRRDAGGEQWFAGAYATHDRRIGEGWGLNLSARIDGWGNTQGFRTEIDKATGARIRDDRYDGQRAVEFSPRLGLERDLDRGWKLRAAAYRAFRVPTLNELYRPFRVGNVNTEANPSLGRESMIGMEAGLSKRSKAGRIGITAFANDLRDAVANVTLGRTPALVSRQRLNLDRIVSRGLEVGGEWELSSTVSMRLEWLWTHAQVERAQVEPALEGKRLAQVPQHTFTAAVAWSPSRSFNADVRVRGSSVQFEDDENLLRLRQYATVDMRLGYRLNKHYECFLSFENSLDREVEVGRSSDGLYSYGPPRVIRLGVRSDW